MRLVRLIHTVATLTTTTATGATLKVGDELRSHRRRFTEGDVAAYAGVSGDRNPVHLNDAFARGTSGFERGHVVHSILVASLFPALIASHFPGAVYASQSLKFAAPVYVGDEVVAQVQALHIKVTSTRHIVKFATKCFTADKETLAIDGEAMAFLPILHLQLNSERPEGVVLGIMEGPADGQVILSPEDAYRNSSTTSTDTNSSSSWHVAELRKLLFRRMLIAVKDSRYFLGLFHCIDKEGNIIL